jgi:signal peptidase I
VPRLLLVMVVLAVAVGARAGLAEPVEVGSDNMAPTLLRGDRVLLDKLTPLVGGVERGELVAFDGQGGLTLKRVVALAGDSVEIRDGELHVNGRRADEPWIDQRRIDGTWFGPVTVGAGQVFVLGDNRGGSIDSRSHGPVATDRLVGRVLVRLSPPVRAGRGRAPVT